jgi:hypothetical protein
MTWCTLSTCGVLSRSSDTAMRSNATLDEARFGGIRLVLPAQILHSLLFVALHW